MSLFLDRADVIAAYRWILGRDPDGEEAIRHQMQSSLTVQDLRSRLFRSEEVRNRQRLPIFDEKWVLTPAGADGPLIWCDLGDPGISFDYLNQWNARGPTAFFDRVTPPDAQVVDVGAGLGWQALRRAARLGRGGAVVAIEPNADLAARIASAASLLETDADVYVEQAAVWDRPGALAFRFAKASVDRGRSVAEPDGFAPDEADVSGQGRARADRLVALLPAEFAPTHVFIDACGSEGRALVGAEGLLAEHRPVVVACLYPDLLRRVSGMRPDDLIAWMVARRYQARLLDLDGVPGEPVTALRLPTGAPRPFILFSPDDQPISS